MALGILTYKIEGPAILTIAGLLGTHLVITDKHNYNVENSHTFRFLRKYSVLNYRTNIIHFGVSPWLATDRVRPDLKIITF